jgi:hypothetical protein
MTHTKKSRGSYFVGFSASVLSFALLVVALRYSTFATAPTASMVNSACITGNINFNMTLFGNPGENIYNITYSTTLTNAAGQVLAQWNQSGLGLDCTGQPVTCNQKIDVPFNSSNTGGLVDGQPVNITSQVSGQFSNPNDPTMLGSFTINVPGQCSFNASTPPPADALCVYVAGSENVCGFGGCKSTETCRYDASSSTGGTCISTASCSSGSTPTPPTYTGPIVDFERFLRAGYTLLLPIAIGIFGIPLIAINGYKIMTSQGDPAAVKDGKEGLTSAIIGIIFVLLAMSILRIILGSFLNVTI